MSALEQLAGAVVMAGFRGVTARAGSLIAEQLATLHLAGVILFDTDAPSGRPGRNITDPGQLVRLTAELRAAAGGPLLIAVDQEGGSVARLKPANGHAAWPSAAELGAAELRAAGDSNSVRAAAGGMAAELAAAGINVNFAPVVDLGLQPANPIITMRGRAYSPDPRVVAECARAFIAAHRAHGIACAIKHFPGHGSTRGDTHLHAQDITATFEPRELEPYRALIHGGEANMIMTGHLLHRGVDPRLPASLSEAWTTGVLRGELGFSGVVVTDDLDMAAAVEAAPPLAERVALALRAGADLLLFGNNLDYDPHRPQQVVEAVIQAVRQGLIEESALHRSAARVRALIEVVSGE